MAAAMPRPTRATTHGRYRPGSSTRTSSTPCATRSLRRIDLRTSGDNRRSLRHVEGPPPKPLDWLRERPLSFRRALINHDCWRRPLRHPKKAGRPAFFASSCSVLQKLPHDRHRRGRSLAHFANFLTHPPAPRTCALLRNRRLGPLAVTVLPIPLARRAVFSTLGPRPH